MLNIHTESWILEKVLKFAEQFSRPEKSLENQIEIKSGKMVKSRNFFFVFKATTSALDRTETFFVLVKSWSISPVCLQRIKRKQRKALFLRFSTVTVKTGMSLRNGMCHGLRNDIIMWNVIYGKWREEKTFNRKACAPLCHAIFGANLSEQSICWSIYYCF